jgi:hypothetical protein
VANCWKNEKKMTEGNVQFHSLTASNTVPSEYSSFTFVSISYYHISSKEAEVVLTQFVVHLLVVIIHKLIHFSFILL